MPHTPIVREIRDTIDMYIAEDNVTRVTADKLMLRYPRIERFGRMIISNVIERYAERNGHEVAVEDGLIVMTIKGEKNGNWTPQ